MADEEHLKILKQGADVWNRWRADNPEIIPNLCGEVIISTDLKGVNLANADLHGMIWITSDFNGADFSSANLRGVYINGSNFISANFRGANLSDARLTFTDLSESGLDGAHLERTYLKRVLISGTSLRNSHIAFTTFADMDLSEVEGLETVTHRAPSSIGIDTIYKSQGKIPYVFLRGAGVPEEFIQYMPHLITGKAIQFYSCFISYSTSDQEFAERLHADLQSKGVRVWFAPEDIKGGRKLHEQIPEAIRLYDKLLLVLSENSMQSEWVKTEIYHARQDEIRNNKRKLFPIGLAVYKKISDWTAPYGRLAKDMAVEIQEYYIPDFSNWKDHDSYKQAFDRLLRDLQAEE